jgi:pyruvate dehydrogenase E2 component (dihydrolipoamide acetyltransferase)
VSGEQQAALYASPRAKALAEKAGADAFRAVPTGPEGRIIERDVRLLIAQGPAETAEAVPDAPDAPAGAAFEDRPLSAVRKIIAENMRASLSEAAQLTHNAAFDASALLAYRALCKENPETARVTLTDMILFAVSRILPAFPALNAWFLGDRTRFFTEVNLACAVDTERGLMVPVVSGAGRLSLRQLSDRVKALAAECQAGRIAPELLTGGSFTVSNLGMYGVESFTPILNPPQTGILGVCAPVTRVRAQDGALSAYPSINLSLTYDHRALDGAPASKFLRALCRSLERFTLLLAE